MSTAFSSLPLSPEMLANLDSLDYAAMTPIQASSSSWILKAAVVLQKPASSPEGM